MTWKTPHSKKKCVYTQFAFRGRFEAQRCVKTESTFTRRMHGVSMVYTPPNPLTYRPRWPAIAYRCRKDASSFRVETRCGLGTFTQAFRRGKIRHLTVSKRNAVWTSLRKRLGSERLLPSNRVETHCGLPVWTHLRESNAIV